MSGGNLYSGQTSRHNGNDDMLEMLMLSLFVGSLGLQATIAGTWQRWQLVAGQRDEEEEELLTRYESQDQGTVTGMPDTTTQSHKSNHANHNGAAPSSKDPRLAGWEFKIVRANRDLFRQADVFQRLCKEEAEAGWILLEKLDDRRVRFKRPIALRDIINPDYLSQDPYRSHYGSPFNLTALLTVLAALSAIVLPAYLGYALVSMKLTKEAPVSSPPPQSFPSPQFPPSP